MANYKTDSRIVLTLDAGGTNMVFSAMRGGEYIIDPITLPSNAKNLDLCLQTLVLGFSTVIDKLEEKPVAISFAFPGPADYPHGITFRTSRLSVTAWLSDRSLRTSSAFLYI